MLDVSKSEAYIDPNDNPPTYSNITPMKTVKSNDGVSQLPAASILTQEALQDGSERSLLK